jgi:uncharacterized membrane protein YgcG
LVSLIGTSSHANRCDCSRIVAPCTADIAVTSTEKISPINAAGDDPIKTWETVVSATFDIPPISTHDVNQCLAFALSDDAGSLNVSEVVKGIPRSWRGRTIYTTREVTGRNVSLDRCGVCADSEVESLRKLSEKSQAEAAEAEKIAAHRAALEKDWFPYGEDASTADLEAISAHYPYMDFQDAMSMLEEERAQAEDTLYKGEESCAPDIAYTSGPCSGDTGRGFDGTEPGNTEPDPQPSSGSDNNPPRDPVGNDPVLSVPNPDGAISISSGVTSGSNPYGVGEGAGGEGDGGREFDPIADLRNQVKLALKTGYDPEEVDKALSQMQSDHDKAEAERIAGVRQSLGYAVESAEAANNRRIERADERLARSRGYGSGGLGGYGSYPSSGYPSGGGSTAGGGPIDEAAEQAKCQRASAPYTSQANVSPADGSMRSGMIAQLKQLELGDTATVACLNAIDPRSDAYRTAKASLEANRARIAQLKRSIDQVSVSTQPVTAKPDWDW